MPTLIVFDPNGKITATAGTYHPSLKDRYTELGGTWIEVDQIPQDISLDEDMYVLEGQLTLRPEFPGILDKTEIQTNNSDTATLSNLPTPCVVLIDGNPIEVNDGSLELTSDLPATYHLTCNCWPYKDWSATVVSI